MSSYNKSCKLKGNSKSCDCEIVEKTLKDRSYSQLIYMKWEVTDN